MAGITFVALTVFATLGSGQHYFFDLVVAVPYAGFIYMVSVVLIGNTEVAHRATAAAR
jgi:hypothetical protein